jgi:hypothetical protein
MLLLLAGIPGYASHLCAQPAFSHAHACCMGHDAQTGSLSGTSGTASLDSSCCRVVPPGSVTVQSLSPSVRPHDGTYGIQAANAAVLDLPLPIARSNRGSPRLMDLRHPPVHALLCTFLV